MTLTAVREQVLCDIDIRNFMRHILMLNMFMIIYFKMECISIMAKLKFLQPLLQ